MVRKGFPFGISVRCGGVVWPGGVCRLGGRSAGQWLWDKRSVRRRAGREGRRGGWWEVAKERMYFGVVRVPPWPPQQVFINVLGIFFKIAPPRGFGEDVPP